MPEVVLVFPKTGFDVGAAIAAPHAVLSVAAPLRDYGYDVRIVDQRVDFNWERSLASALKSNPLFVGVSSMTGTQIHFALAAAKAVRQNTGKDVPLVWGGCHPTILPEETLENEYVDVVVKSEGEITLLELANALEKNKPLKNILGIGYKERGRQRQNPLRPLMDVEKLLPTSWELVDVEKYIYKDLYLEGPRTLDIGETSRGCPFKCGFCCSAAIRRRQWRPMSVKKSLDKIVSDVQRFKLTGIWIRDDNFYVNPKRSEEICRGMVREKLDIAWYTSGTRVRTFNALSPDSIRLLKKSGASVLKFGAESGCNRILKLMDKQLTIEETFQSNLRAKKFGIIPAYSFIGGFPTETWEELMETIDAMIRIMRDNPQAIVESLCIYTPLPATPMYNLALKHGLKPPRKLEDWSDWSFHDYNDRRNPWLSKSKRRMLGNMTYISSMSSVVMNLVDSLPEPQKSVITPFAALASRYYQWRWNRKKFAWTPELTMLRYIRHHMFDR
ncbi:B12-binding domain-containing radical SAM protein [Candidatus Micrarchaeota archaeon]|nr:B12-binding domain-containing radical SAM protein [Candidatus Micrarchaeota archaeon]